MPAHARRPPPTPSSHAALSCPALPCHGAALAASGNPGLAKLVVGLIFPVGLLMVTICGAELYTGNTAVVAAAVFEGKATWRGLLRNWALSYAGGWVPRDSRARGGGGRGERGGCWPGGPHR